MAPAFPYTPDPPIAWFSERYFSRISVDPAWIRASAHEGAVVHVLRSRSYLDFLALDYLLKRAGLSPLGFVADTGLGPLEPFGQGVARVLGPREPAARRLESAVTSGHSALLFMGQARRETDAADPIRVLIDIVRRTGRKVVLVPQVLVWGKEPDSREESLVDRLFGPTDSPGRIRVLARFLRNYDNAVLRAGDPLDLNALLAETPGDDDALARKVHWVLFRRLDRERRVVLGPVQKGPDRLATEVLRTPRVQRTLDDLATRTRKAKALVEADAFRELQRLGARPDPWVIDLFDRAFGRILQRIFDGVVVDTEGFDRIREAARRGPVVLLPSHRSHLDYLLLSWACYHHGLSTPLIAAGDNLAFWPLGPALRRGGAFFIRRTVQGESARLYATLLDGYVRKVMREGYLIEFFFEGGRSRTGRVLPARLGLLSLVVDAAAAGGEAVSFVPISIAYDRVVEGRSYVEELLGAQKKQEDVESLLEVPAVLAARYGCAYLRVGEITVQQPEASEADGTEAPATPQGRKAERDKMVSRRSELNKLARRLVGEIHRVTPITPSALLALALLSHPGRGLSRLELDAAAARLLALLSEAGAPVAPTLADLAQGIERGVELLRDAGMLTVEGIALDAVFTVPDKQRLALDYYKNNILHRVVASSVVASALVAGGGVRVRGRSVARDVVMARATEIARLFHHEFSHALELEPALEPALEGMLRRAEVVAREDGSLAAPDDEGALWLGLLAGAVRNYLESYRIAARVLTAIVGAAMPLKQMLSRALGVGRKMFLAGEVTRREAVSKQNLENAFGAFRALGYLGGGDGGPQRLKSPHDTAEGAAAIEAQIAALLP